MSRWHMLFKGRLNNHYYLGLADNLIVMNRLILCMIC